MVALDVLLEVQARGARLQADGDRLTAVAPRGAVTLELSELIRLHKVEILALLGGAHDEQPDPTCRAGDKPADEEQPFPCAPVVVETVPAPAITPRCRCCRTPARTWRLSPRHPWVCCACHPPAPAIARGAEWAEVSRP